MSAGVVIVGAGHGGVQAATALRQEGYAGRIVLVDEEGVLPYRRPPLSKAYLKGDMSLEQLAFRRQAFYDEHRIERVAARVAALDRAGCRVMLADEGALPYEHLVLAPGARNRPLTVPGADGPGVLGIRTLADADRLRGHLAQARHVVVIGAGFIGLEFAAVAAAAGAEVDVIELAALPMGRALSPAMAQFFLDHHRSAGLRFHTGAAVAAIERDASGAVCAVQLADGTRLAAELVVYGIGVVPNQELALEAGLACDNGIVVDRRLLTADARISVIGDAASFPAHESDHRLRLESVQNATDQARHVAARIATGAQAQFDAVPWFWSDQGSLRLQIAGLGTGVDETVTVGTPQAAKFSILGFRAGRLVCVESVNQPAEHMAARKLLAADALPCVPEAAVPGFSLKGWAQSPMPTPRG